MLHLLDALYACCNPIFTSWLWTLVSLHLLDALHARCNKEWRSGGLRIVIVAFVRCTLRLSQRGVTSTEMGDEELHLFDALLASRIRIQTVFRINCVEAVSVEMPPKMPTKTP